MKKKTIILSAIVLCLVCVIGCISVLTPKDYLAVQNDGVYFGMSLNSLKKIKGEPNQINKNICDTPFDE